MTHDAHAQQAKPPDTRRTSTVTGWLMVVTFATSIPAYFTFYAPVRQDPGLITGAGADPTASVALGAVLELVDERALPRRARQVVRARAAEGRVRWQDVANLHRERDAVVGQHART